MSADPTTPVPYWIAPTNADTAPARAGKRLSAPAIELATMKPVAEMNKNSGMTSPNRPPQSVHAFTVSNTPASAAPKLPARISASLPKRLTSFALIRFETMTPTTPTPNSRP